MMSAQFLFLAESRTSSTADCSLSMLATPWKMMDLLRYFPRSQIVSPITLERMIISFWGLAIPTIFFISSVLITFRISFGLAISAEDLAEMSMYGGDHDLGSANSPAAFVPNCSAKFSDSDQLISGCSEEKSTSYFISYRLCQI
jgi:hypothetical protein